MPPPLPSLPLVLYTLSLEGEAPPPNTAPVPPSSPPLPSSPQQRSTQRSSLASKQAFAARMSEPSGGGLAGAGIAGALDGAPPPRSSQGGRGEGGNGGIIGAPPPRSPQRPPRQSLAGGPVGWLSNLFKHQSPAHGTGAVPSASASAPAAAPVSASEGGPSEECSSNLNIIEDYAPPPVDEGAVSGATPAGSVPNMEVEQSSEAPLHMECSPGGASSVGGFEPTPSIVLRRERVEVRARARTRGH